MTMYLLQYVQDENGDIKSYQIYACTDTR